MKNKLLLLNVCTMSLLGVHSTYAMRGWPKKTVIAPQSSPSYSDAVQGKQPTTTAAQPPIPYTPPYAPLLMPRSEQSIPGDVLRYPAPAQKPDAIGQEQGAPKVTPEATHEAAACNTNDSVEALPFGPAPMPADFAIPSPTLNAPFAANMSRAAEKANADLAPSNLQTSAPFDADMSQVAERPNTDFAPNNMQLATALDPSAAGDTSADFVSVDDQALMCPPLVEPSSADIAQKEAEAQDSTQEGFLWRIFNSPSFAFTRGQQVRRAVAHPKNSESQKFLKDTDGRNKAARVLVEDRSSLYLEEEAGKPTLSPMLARIALAVDDEIKKRTNTSLHTIESILSVAQAGHVLINPADLLELFNEIKQLKDADISNLNEQSLLIMQTMGQALTQLIRSEATRIAQLKKIQKQTSQLCKQTNNDPKNPSDDDDKQVAQAVAKSSSHDDNDSKTGKQEAQAAAKSPSDDKKTVDTVPMAPQSLHKCWSPQEVVAALEISKKPLRFGDFEISIKYAPAS